MAARYYNAVGASEKAVTFAMRATQSDPAYKPAAIFMAIQELASPSSHQTGVDGLMKIVDGDDAYSYLAIAGTRSVGQYGGGRRKGSVRSGTSPARFAATGRIVHPLYCSNPKY